MAPKIEFRDRSSGQRGSNSDVLEGPKLSCAWEDRGRSLERFFESHFWFMFSQSKLKCLPSRFQHRHLDWELAEKHRYFHFITIPFDSIQFQVLSKVQSWSETHLITTAKQSSDQSPCLALSSQEFRMLTQTEWFERWSHEIHMKWFCFWNSELHRWIRDDKQTLSLVQNIHRSLANFETQHSIWVSYVICVTQSVGVDLLSRLFSV